MPWPVPPVTVTLVTSTPFELLTLSPKPAESMRTRPVTVTPSAALIVSGTPTPPPSICAPLPWIVMPLVVTTTVSL